MNPTRQARRREFPKSVRLAAFERANGKCEGCDGRLYPGKFHYDHDLPDGLGGEPTLDNCVVRCTACHGLKTAKKDVPAIAKADRVKAKSIGAKQARNPMPGSRKSKWKKKIGGEVVLRESEP
jgi:5-methylcytosine-specific restriction enzyme A